MNTFCYIPRNEGPGYAEKYELAVGHETSLRHTAHKFIYFPSRKINLFYLGAHLKCYHMFGQLETTERLKFGNSRTLRSSNKFIFEVPLDTGAIADTSLSVFYVNMSGVFFINSLSNEFYRMIRIHLKATTTGTRRFNSDHVNMNLFLVNLVRYITNLILVILEQF